MPPEQQGLPISTTSNQTLDPQAVDLAKAIRSVETQGTSNPFVAKGKSGEYGAYQFTPDTWNKLSQKYGVSAPLENTTPQQQNEVAYKQIKEWKDKGFNVGQIASMWNAGEGAPDAYKDPNFQGVNKFGAKFNVPAYAKGVATAYQNIKAGKSTQGITTPSTIGGEAQPQEKGFFDNLFGGNILGAGKNLLDFAFPVVQDVIDNFAGKNKKTILQQLGDAGLSALWFVPGFGVAGSVLGHAAEGAAIGYGAGALSSLSQGKGVGESLLPSTENVVGALTGGVAGGLIGKASKFLGRNITEEGALKAVQENLDSAIKATKSGVRLTSASAERGFNPSELLAKSGAIPDVIDGKFVTNEAENLINQRIAELGKTRAIALDTIGSTVPLDELKNQALSQISKLAATGETGKMSNQIKRIFEDFKNSFGETLSASELEAIKEAQASASGIYRRTGQIGEQNASSIIGNVARSKIEELAANAGFPGMDEYNRYISQHYNALEALNKLNGQTVKGGRLGNMLRGHAIGGIGALGASSMGGGFLGALAGGAGGELVNSMLSKILGDSSFSNPLRDIILRRIEMENPQIVRQLQEFATKKVVSGGDVAKINKLLETVKTSVAPLLQPRTSKIKGLIPRTATQATVRGLIGVGSQ